MAAALGLLRVQDYTALEMAAHAAVNAINAGVGWDGRPSGLSLVSLPDLGTLRQIWSP